MTQLLDLDDDSLLEVLDRLPADELFTMLRVNSRLRRLAGDKMRVKIKAVVADTGFLQPYLMQFKGCAHLGSRQDQILVLDKLTSVWRGETVLSSVLPRLADVKAIDLMGQRVSSGMLEDIVQHCPQLECLKIGWLYVRDDDWERFLDQIGEKIVHFTKNWHEEDRNTPNMMDKNNLLKMIVEKCVNIKRLDWLQYDLIGPLSVVKKLPKSCWVNLYCYCFNEDVYEDVVDELLILELNWSSFGRRVDRLSDLSFFGLKHDEDSFVGVNFAGLKTLNFIPHQYYRQSVDCLIASRFPRLEEFRFSITAGLTEDDFDALFQRMTSVKKLSIVCCNDTFMKPRLPVTAILKLKELETIVFGFYGEPNDWHFQILFQQLEQYIYEIRSLKKLTVSMRYYSRGDTRETAIGKFKRLKAKQTRVQIELLL